MMFVIDNQTKFCSGLDVHGLNTRNRNQLHLPNSNLSAFQKGTMFTAIKLLNRLPITIQSLIEDRISLKKIVFISYE
jgi:hypothetical protein